MADFSQALATIHDKFGHELQMLVETYRKRNGELRKERLVGLEWWRANWAARRQESGALTPLSVPPPPRKPKCAARLQCPNSLFQIWELFLQQVEVNSQQHGDISRNFNQNIGNGLIERVFHRKIQSKKIFAHRDRIEAILVKSNELLLKVSRSTASCRRRSRKPT